MSFRLGRHDGVSVVAATWARVLARPGVDGADGRRRRAGRPPAARVWPSVRPRRRPPRRSTPRWRDADLVVVENLCTIPLNLPAARAVAAGLRGRPAVLHHHDPPWQRAQWAHVTELPPTDPAWRHVTINHLTEREMAARGIETTTIYNGFDVDEPPGDRAGTRAALGGGRRRAPARAPGAGDRAQGRPGRARAGRGARTPPTGWSVRPRTATRRRSTRTPRAAPGSRDPPAVARHDGRRLRRRRRGGVPVHVGGVRQPADRGRHPSATRRGRAPTRWPRSCGRSGFRWFDPDRPDELDAFLRAARPVAPRPQRRRAPGGTSGSTGSRGTSSASLAGWVP